MSEKFKLEISPEKWKRMRELYDNPVGFRCWDCGEEITGINIEEYKGQKYPVSHDGYIMMLCGCQDEY